jgi:Family of unknown function (DUF5681)
MNQKSEPDSKPNPSWFPKGQSGNPRGRPKTTRALQTSILDVVMEKTLTMALPGGGAREITLEEALQRQTLQRALQGDRKAQREVLKWIRKLADWLAKNVPAPLPKITRRISPDPDNADAALLLLGIADHNPARADIKSERAQLLLQPWAVQAALSRRRGGSRLTDQQRNTIRRCTRDPDSLIWPRGTDK